MKKSLNIFKCLYNHQISFRVSKKKYGTHSYMRVFFANFRFIRYHIMLPVSINVGADLALERKEIFLAPPPSMALT